MAFNGARLLVLQKNNAISREIPIRAATVKFGSHPLNTIRLKSGTAERLHCKIYAKNEKVIIVNYSSEKPIKLDGKIIRKRNELNNGCILEVCGTRFRWLFDERQLTAGTQNPKRTEEQTPVSSRCGKRRRTTILRNKQKPDRKSTASGASKKCIPKKTNRTPVYTLPKNRQQLIKNIRKRFTVHNIADNQTDDEEDDYENMPDIVEQQSKTPVSSTVSSTNNTPFYTPEMGKENTTFPSAKSISKTPTLQLENSAMMILSYTPTIGTRSKLNMLKTPTSSVKTFKKRESLRSNSENVSPFTRAQSNNVITPAKSKAGSSMYLIDLTTPGSGYSSNYTCSPLRESNSSSQSAASFGLIDLITPSPKKSKLPSCAVPKSAQKGLLKSALKNASKTPRALVGTPKLAPKIIINDSVSKSVPSKKYDKTPNNAYKFRVRNLGVSPVSSKPVSDVHAASSIQVPKISAFNQLRYSENVITANATLVSNNEAKEAPPMTTDEIFDTLLGRQSIKMTYTRKSKSPKKVHPPLIADANSSSELPKTDIDLWVESVVEATCSKTVDVESAIKKPNRTTQIRSSQYSDITPHESFVELVTAASANPEYQEQESTNEMTSEVLNKSDLENLSDMPSISNPIRKSHTPLASKIVRSLDNKRQTIGSFFTNIFGKLAVSPVTKLSITDDKQKLEQDDQEGVLGNDTNESEDVYHESETGFCENTRHQAQNTVYSSPKLPQSLRNTRKFIGNALISLNTSKSVLDNTAEIDESLLLNETGSSNVENCLDDDGYDLTDLSSAHQVDHQVVLPVADRLLKTPKRKSTINTSISKDCADNSMKLNLVQHNTLECAKSGDSPFEAGNIQHTSTNSALSNSINNTPMSVRTELILEEHHTLHNIGETEKSRTGSLSKLQKSNGTPIISCNNSESNYKIMPSPFQNAVAEGERSDVSKTRMTRRNTTATLSTPKTTTGKNTPASESRLSLRVLRSTPAKQVVPTVSLPATYDTNSELLSEVELPENIQLSTSVDNIESTQESMLEQDHEPTEELQSTTFDESQIVEPSLSRLELVSDTSLHQNVTFAENLDSSVAVYDEKILDKTNVKGLNVISITPLSKETDDEKINISQDSTRMEIDNIAFNSNNSNASNSTAAVPNTRRMSRRTISAIATTPTPAIVKNSSRKTVCTILTTPKSSTVKNAPVSESKLPIRVLRTKQIATDSLPTLKNEKPQSADEVEYLKNTNSSNMVGSNQIADNSKMSPNEVSFEMKHSVLIANPGLEDENNKTIVTAAISDASDFMATAANVSQSEQNDAMPQTRTSLLPVSASGTPLKSSASSSIIIHTPSTSKQIHNIRANEPLESKNESDLEPNNVHNLPIDSTNVKRMTRRTTTSIISTPKTNFAQSVPLSESKLKLRTLRMAQKAANEVASTDSLSNRKATLFGDIEYLESANSSNLIDSGEITDNLKIFHGEESFDMKQSSDAVVVANPESGEEVNQMLLPTKEISETTERMPTDDDDQKAETSHSKQSNDISKQQSKTLSPVGISNVRKITRRTTTGCTPKTNIVEKAPLRASKQALRVLRTAQDAGYKVATLNSPSISDDKSTKISGVTEYLEYTSSLNFVGRSEIADSFRQSLKGESFDVKQSGQEIIQTILPAKDISETFKSMAADVDENQITEINLENAKKTVDIFEQQTEALSPVGFTNVRRTTRRTTTAIVSTPIAYNAKNVSLNESKLTLGALRKAQKDINKTAVLNSSLTLKDKKVKLGGVFDNFGNTSSSNLVGPRGIIDNSKTSEVMSTVDENQIAETTLLQSHQENNIIEQQSDMLSQISTSELAASTSETPNRSSVSSLVKSHTPTCTQIDNIGVTLVQQREKELVYKTGKLQNAIDEIESTDIHNLSIGLAKAKRMTRRTTAGVVSTPKTNTVKTAPVTDSKLTLRILRTAQHAANEVATKNSSTSIANKKSNLFGEIEYLENTNSSDLADNSKILDDSKLSSTGYQSPGMKQSNNDVLLAYSGSRENIHNATLPAKEISEAFEYSNSDEHQIGDPNLLRVEQTSDLFERQSESTLQSSVLPTVTTGTPYKSETSFSPSISKQTDDMFGAKKVQNVIIEHEAGNVNDLPVGITNSRRMTRRTIASTVSTPTTNIVRNIPASESKLSLRSIWPTQVLEEQISSIDSVSIINKYKENASMSGELECLEDTNSSIKSRNNDIIEPVGESLFVEQSRNIPLNISNIEEGFKDANGTIEHHSQTLSNNSTLLTASLSETPFDTSEGCSEPAETAIDACKTVSQIEPSACPKVETLTSMRKSNRRESADNSSRRATRSSILNADRLLEVSETDYQKAQCTLSDSIAMSCELQLNQTKSGTSDATDIGDQDLSPTLVKDCLTANSNLSNEKTSLFQKTPSSSFISPSTRCATKKKIDSNNFESANSSTSYSTRKTIAPDTRNSSYVSYETPARATRSRATLSTKESSSPTDAFANADEISNKSSVLKGKMIEIAMTPPLSTLFKTPVRMTSTPYIKSVTSAEKDTVSNTFESKADCELNKTWSPSKQPSTESGENKEDSIRLHENSTNSIPPTEQITRLSTPKSNHKNSFAVDSPTRNSLPSIDQTSRSEKEANPEMSSTFLSNALAEKLNENDQITGERLPELHVETPVMHNLIETPSRTALSTSGENILSTTKELNNTSITLTSLFKTPGQSIFTDTSATAAVTPMSRSTRKIKTPFSATGSSTNNLTTPITKNIQLRSSNSEKTSSVNSKTNESSQQDTPIMQKLFETPVTNSTLAASIVSSQPTVENAALKTPVAFTDRKKSARLTRNSAVSITMSIGKNIHTSEQSSHCELTPLLAKVKRRESMFNQSSVSSNSPTEKVTANDAPPQPVDEFFNSSLNACSPTVKTSIETDISTDLGKEIDAKSLSETTTIVGNVSLSSCSNADQPRSDNIINVSKATAGNISTFFEESQATECNDDALSSSVNEIESETHLSRSSDVHIQSVMVEINNSNSADTVMIPSTTCQTPETNTSHLFKTPASVCSAVEDKNAVGNVEGVSPSKSLFVVERDSIDESLLKNLCERVVSLEKELEALQETSLDDSRSQEANVKSLPETPNLSHLQPEIENGRSTRATAQNKRKLYTRNNPENTTPESRKSIVVQPVSSNEYLCMLDSTKNVIENTNAGETKDEQNDSSDWSAASTSQEIKNVKRVLPSRASRRNIKTLCEEELAGTSPEVKFVKPKPITIEITIDESNKDIVSESRLSDDTVAGRRKVMFNDNIQVKEINSPAIVGDIIKKISSRGRGRKLPKPAEIMEETTQPNATNNDPLPIVDQSEDPGPKRTRRGNQKKNAVASELAKPRNTRQSKRKVENLINDADSTNELNDGVPASGSDDLFSDKAKDVINHSPARNARVKRTRIQSRSQKSISNEGMNTNNDLPPVKDKDLNLHQASMNETEDACKDLNSLEIESKATSRDTRKKTKSVKSEKLFSETTVVDKINKVVKQSTADSTIETIEESVLPQKDLPELKEESNAVTKTQPRASRKQTRTTKTSTKNVRALKLPESESLSDTLDTSNQNETKLKENTKKNPKSTRSVKTIKTISEQTEDFEVKLSSDINHVPNTEISNKDDADSEVVFRIPADNEKLYKKTKRPLRGARNNDKAGLEQKDSSAAGKRKQDDSESNTTVDNIDSSKTTMNQSDENKVEIKPRRAAARKLPSKRSTRQAKSKTEQSPDEDASAHADNLASVPETDEPAANEAIMTHAHEKTAEEPENVIPPKRGRRRIAPAKTAVEKVLKNTVASSLSNVESTETSQELQGPVKRSLRQTKRSPVYQEPPARGLRNNKQTSNTAEVHQEESLNESHMVKTILSASHTSTPLLKATGSETSPSKTKATRKRGQKIVNPIITALVEEERNQQRKSPRKRPDKINAEKQESEGNTIEKKSLEMNVSTDTEMPTKRNRRGIKSRVDTKKDNTASKRIGDKVDGADEQPKKKTKTSEVASEHQSDVSVSGESAAAKSTRRIRGKKSADAVEAESTTTANRKRPARSRK
ncbi:uncharacterized protein LOC128739898 [Sabethes cyaneus]|uniref:uncharacterized protein LOC128739898 n=1 Tax=Sabethes cyaneus TaxID=53552 RepID=UPI00237E5D29|nr:uncharacterized protein LOC128739898 [Sabethes cyaneus]